MFVFTMNLIWAISQTVSNKTAEEVSCEREGAGNALIRKKERKK